MSDYYNPQGSRNRRDYDETARSSRSRSSQASQYGSADGRRTSSQSSNRERVVLHQDDFLNSRDSYENLYEQPQRSARSASRSASQYSRYSDSYSSGGGSSEGRSSERRLSEGRSRRSQQGESARRSSSRASARSSSDRSRRANAEGSRQARANADATRQARTGAESSRRANAGASRRSQQGDNSHRGGTDGYGRNEYLSQKPPRDKRKIVKIVIIALVALLAIAGIAIAIYVNNISDNLHEGVTDEVRDALVETEYSKEPFYMLLMGTDESEERDGEDYGGSFRSDSMMLCRVDCPNKKVTLVSLERDTLIDMGEYGVNKLNVAALVGGPGYAIEVVSNLAGVPISHYAVVNFDGFCAAVDALGGIEVDVPIEIDDDDAGGYLAAGRQTLNGEQALILCRSRNAYEEYGAGNSFRSANQRLVLSAIAQKTLDSDVGTIASTVSALSEYVTTDLELSDIIGIAQALRGLDMESDMYTAMQPTEARYEDGLWFNVTIEPDWTNMMARVDQGLPPTETDQVDAASGTILASTGTGDAFDVGTKSGMVVIRNGGAPQGTGGIVGEKVEVLGYETDIGNANGDYTRTLVVFSNPASRKDALQLANMIGGARLFLNNGKFTFDGDFMIILGSDYTG